MRTRRTWGQRTLIGFNVLVVMACLAAALGLYLFRQTATELVRVPIAGGSGGIMETAGPSEPKNFLLVGVDDAEGIDPDDPILRGRDQSLNTDVIMIMRVDPVAHQAWILSLPRDLWVAIPPSRSENGKLNAALATGGPETLVKTISENFDIPIHAYVEVSFAGFKQIVDVLDGVPVYFPWEARDQKTGLFQYDPGCVVLEGDQALAYVRSRAFEIKNENGYWEGDSTSDLGRIERQQEFVRAAMRRAIDRGARNPVTLGRLVNSGKDAVALDQYITIAEIMDLGEEMREFDPEQLVVLQPPVSGFRTAGGADVLRINERDAKPILDVFRGANLSDVETLVRVEVLNGTGRTGQAKEVGEELTEFGFGWAQSFDDSSFDRTETSILYASDADNRDLVAAALLARYLDLDVEISQGDMRSPDANVALLIGNDFSGFRSEPRPLADFADVLPPEVIEESEAVAQEADGGSGGASQVTIAPTTSSIDAFVPAAPEGEECR